MFYPMADSRFQIGGQYAWKNSDFAVADFAADVFQTIGEVESIGSIATASKEVTFDALFPAFVRRVKGPRDFKIIEVVYAVDTADAQQTKLQTAEQQKADYGFHLILADAPVVAASGVVAVSIGAPGVFTWTGSPLKSNCQVQLASTGLLPTGLAVATTYFVVSSTANTFSLALTLGGAPIATTGTQSGFHTLTSTPQPSERFFIAKVMSIEDDFGSGPEAVFKRKATLAVNCKPVNVAALP